MQIQSAVYNRDSDGNVISIHIVSNSVEADVPINGNTWINQAFEAWLISDSNNKIQD